MKAHFIFGRTARAACGKNGVATAYRDLNKGDFKRWLALPDAHKCAHCLNAYAVKKEIAKHAKE